MTSNPPIPATYMGETCITTFQGDVAMAVVIVLIDVSMWLIPHSFLSHDHKFKCFKN